MKFGKVDNHLKVISGIGRYVALTDNTLKVHEEEPATDKPE